ncbi:hypothetical protein [Bacillus mobilis]
MCHTVCVLYYVSYSIVVIKTIIIYQKIDTKKAQTI